MFSKRIPIFLFLVGLFFVPSLASAHQSGCHRWHSCPSDTGSYVCGDLGYPCIYPTYPTYPSLTVTEPQAKALIAIADRNFVKVFNRKANAEESAYWGMRYVMSPGMSDEAVLRREMQDFLDLGYSYSAVGNGDGSKVQGQVKKEILAERDKIASKDAPIIVEREFQKVFAKKPSIQESTYWKKRARSDKKTVLSLRGAMIFQKGKGVTMSGVKISQ